MLSLHPGAGQPPEAGYLRLYTSKQICSDIFNGWYISLAIDDVKSLAGFIN